MLTDLVTQMDQEPPKQVWVCVSVTMSLSLDDGTWLYLKAVSVLDSVGQNPRVIHFKRWWYAWFYNK